MEQNELQRTLMAILFAAGEPVSVQRLAQTLGRDPDEIRRETRQLMDALSFHRSGIRIVQLEDAFQMCSAAEQAEFVSRTLETRKPPKLSQSQLETLTVIAYYQPATKAYVEQIRGVDSAYTVGSLTDKGLIEECGRLDVPGRPILYRTTESFLRSFGLSSVSQLPALESFGTEDSGQLTLSDLEQPETEEAPPAESEA